MKETGEKVMSDSLKYTGRMLMHMVNTVLIFAGVILILLPFILAGGWGFRVLGIALILTAVLRIFLNKRGVSIVNSPKAAYGFVLICQLTALVLELLPNAYIMPFSDGPHKYVTSAYSYFDLISFGYGDYCPILTGILTVMVLVLCVIGLIGKNALPKVQNAAFTCSIFALVTSVLLLFWGGIAFMSEINYIIPALILISIVIEAVANRQRK